MDVKLCVSQLKQFTFFNCRSGSSQVKGYRVVKKFTNELYNSNEGQIQGPGTRAKDLKAN